MLHPKLEAKLDQKLILTPTLQQAIKLLQLNRVELAELLKREVEQNPVLEEVLQESGEEVLKGEKKENKVEDIDLDAYFQEYYEQSSPMPSYWVPEEQPSIENIPAPQMNLEDYLFWQMELLELPESIKNALKYLIENLNEDGYLEEKLENLCNENFPLEALKKAKLILMSMDPPGIGSENIKECLIAQAQTEILKEAIDKGWEEILQKDYDGLCKKLNISKEECQSIANAIKYLDPFPGRRFGKESSVFVEPDVFVYKKGNKFEVIVNEDGLPKLKVSRFYLRLMKSIELSKDKEALEYLENKLQSAFWLLRSIEQRRKTLTNVAKAIVEYQREAVEKGKEFIKPLILKNIAEEVNVHESTVSRIVSNKFMLTPAGLFLMRDFFISGIKTVSGELKSVEEVKKAIKEIIERENKNKPFKDTEISRILYRDYRIFIARRTVAKYREELNLPSYKERKRS